MRGNFGGQMDGGPEIRKGTEQNKNTPLLRVGVNNKHDKGLITNKTRFFFKFNYKHNVNKK